MNSQYFCGTMIKLSRGGGAVMLNIVLVEPEIPQNCGNIARTCAATGAHLHLVKPLGFDISDRAVKRAGLDYWHLVDISVYENLRVDVAVCWTTEHLYGICILFLSYLYIKKGNWQKKQI